MNNKDCGLNASISVVIPAYGHSPFLIELLCKLKEGTKQPDEVIVSHSGSNDPSDEVEMHFPDVLVLHSTQRLLAGAARNRGADLAKGSYIAFIDSDVRPRKSWLTKLSMAIESQPGQFCVGSVGVARSGDYWGMCTWLLEFSEQSPWRPSGEQNGGASCNMIIQARDLEAQNGFPETYQPGEDTALFCGLRDSGLRQWFVPDARVDHYNHQGFAPFSSQMKGLGYHSALVRQEFPLRGSLATRIRPLSLLLWIPKTLLVIRRAFSAGPGEWFRTAYYLPGILIGAFIWTAGFVKQVYETAP